MVLKRQLWSADDSSLSKKYWNTAPEIVYKLSSPNYRAAIGENGDFILKHSVENMNANAEVDTPLP